MSENESEHTEGSYESDGGDGFNPSVNLLIFHLIFKVGQEA